MKRRFREATREAHDDYLFRTLRFGDSTRCFSFFSLSSHFYVKWRRIKLRNKWNNEIQQKIVSYKKWNNDTKNREPYNNKITLCLIFFYLFESLYPSETEFKTTNDTDGFFFHHHQLFLKEASSPRTQFFFVDGSMDQVDSPLSSF